MSYKFKYNNVIPDEHSGNAVFCLDEWAGNFTYHDMLQINGNLYNGQFRICWLTNGSQLCIDAIYQGSDSGTIVIFDKA
jgi:hypothetical protein